MKTVNGVSINGKAAIENRPFALIQSIVEVSTAWKKEQENIERRKVQRRKVEEQGAYAALALSNVAPLETVRKFGHDRMMSVIGDTDKANIDAKVQAAREFKKSQTLKAVA